MAKYPTKLAAAAIVALAIGHGIPAHAAPTTAQDCVDAGNVWIHVEFDETVTGACAEEFSTALEATRSAGLTEDAGSFITTISGRAANGTTAKEWWSLWTKHVDADGKHPEWSFATVGAGDIKPQAGDVIGWRLDEDWDKVPAPAPKQDPLADAAKPAAGDKPKAPVSKVGLPQVGVPNTGV